MSEQEQRDTDSSAVEWKPISDLPKYHCDFVWVVSEKCRQPWLAFADGFGRIQTAHTAGDREGLSIDYEQDITHFADIVAPEGPDMLAARQPSGEK